MPLRHDINCSQLVFEVQAEAEVKSVGGVCIQFAVITESAIFYELLRQLHWRGFTTGASSKSLFKGSFRHITKECGVSLSF